MSKNEKQFQNYFMKVAKPFNFHRTAILNGSGYPDVTAFHGERHSLIELKDLVLGKRGDRKLIGLFEKSQTPFYVSYFQHGGKRLFVAWRVTDWNGSNKRYGVWKLNMHDAMGLSGRYYKDLSSRNYREFSNCTEMIKAIEEM